MKIVFLCDYTPQIISVRVCQGQGITAPFSAARVKVAPDMTRYSGVNLVVDLGVSR